MSNELELLVEKIQYLTKLSRKEIAERVGYTREYISVAIRNNTKGKITEALKKEFATVLNENNTSSEKAEPIVNKTDEPIANDKNELSLHSLIESNKVLVETNKELTGLLKVIINSGSAHSSPAQDTLYAILERIAEQGRKFWGTKEEGLKELGKYLYGGKEKDKTKGS